MGEDGVWALHQARDDLRKIGGVVFGIVGGWRDVFTIAVAARVKEHAAELAKFSRCEPPYAAVAAVAVKAK